MKEKTLLSLPVDFSSRQAIFQKIAQNLEKEKNFLHIVSLNPELTIIAQNNFEFKKILSKAEIQICDGTGVYFASKFLGIPCKERISGVDLMDEILHNFHDRSLSVVLIGGRNELAKELAKCYKNKYPKSMFFGLEGYENINKPSIYEEKELKTCLEKLHPDIVFVAFGSPAQELWIDSHRALMPNSVCMGVGGGFDFLGNKVPRAPYLMRQLGIEWLFRLIIQPWRIFRQLRLVQFIYLVIRQKIAL